MPSPSTSLSTLRPDLGGSFEEFSLAMDRAGFIGHRVLPVFITAKQSGPFGKIPIEQLLQKRDTKRGVNGKYNRGDWTFTTDSFACQEFGAEEPVDDREAEMYADYFDAEMVSAERARDAVLRDAEERIADAIYNTTTWTPTSVTNEWDDATNATPQADVESAVQTIWGNSGIWPNAIVMNRKVFRNLRLTDDFQAAVASSGAGSSQLPGLVTVEQVAQYFALEHVLVAGPAKNTADEGQSATLSPIWSDEYVWIGRIAETGDIREPCVGRTFNWREDGGDVSAPMESYRDETIRADVIRARHDVHEKIIYSAVGALLDNITT